MSIPKHSALILGGTGAVGKCLVRDALASNAFSRVLALGRRPVPLDNTFTNTAVLDQKTVDFEHVQDSFPSDLPQVVFCTLGTNLTSAPSVEAWKRVDQQYVVDSARYIHEKAPKDPETGLSKVHFLYCSAVGANHKSFFLGTRTKGETEQALAKIGFERVSIFQPAILKVVEPRESVTYVERIATKFVPLLDYVAEKSTTVSVATVAQCMRLVGTSDTPEVAGVAPKKVEVFPESKTTVAYYSNAKIHEIVNSASKL
ncbi:oxidoreductase [Entomortierella parvispora]|uniref:Oxidoreductase n=1 Tax=Entomortierella parvispora TaxID=205924 RepID=A0A9P3HE41_9FUNG|nr:oxidoreductase [Entomortierella parvispora]